MIVYLVIYLVIVLIGLRLNKSEKYLEKSQTTTINGIFILMVFISHFYSYYDGLDGFNKIPGQFVGKFGQLMVAPFLFFSGYGIYESIKRKKDYIKTFPKNRFLKIYINFSLALLLYVVMNIILHNNYSLSQILLSFTGYESIGNSNWYMFATFIMYITVLIAFAKKINEKINNFSSIVLVSLFSVLYIYIVSKYRGIWYVDTIICFPIGMFYSYFKDSIRKTIDNNYSYYILLVFSLISFLILYHQPYNIYLYNVESVFFVIFIALLLKKVYISSTILNYLGKNLFWIYILQRVPMILLTNKINIIICFPLCLLITLVGMVIMKYVSNYIIKKIKI